MEGSVSEKMRFSEKMSVDIATDRLNQIISHLEHDLQTNVEGSLDERVRHIEKIVGGDTDPSEALERRLQTTWSMLYGTPRKSASSHMLRLLDTSRWFRVHYNLLQFALVSPRNSGRSKSFSRTVKAQNGGRNHHKDSSEYAFKCIAFIDTFSQWILLTPCMIHL